MSRVARLAHRARSAAVEVDVHGLHGVAPSNRTDELTEGELAAHMRQWIKMIPETTGSGKTYAKYESFDMNCVGDLARHFNAERASKPVSSSSSCASASLPPSPAAACTAPPLPVPPSPSLPSSPPPLPASLSSPFSLPSLSFPPSLSLPPPPRLPLRPVPWA